jgi:hypothetical protein
VKDEKKVEDFTGASCLLLDHRICIHWCGFVAGFWVEIKYLSYIGLTNRDVLSMKIVKKSFDMDFFRTNICFGNDHIMKFLLWLENIFRLRWLDNIFSVGSLDGNRDPPKVEQARLLAARRKKLSPASGDSHKIPPSV